MRIEKFGFADHFINWNKILLNDQPSCVINDQPSCVINDQPSCVTNDQPSCAINDQPSCVINDQPSCVINGRFASQYFTLKRSACQGDPISAYLFIIALEVLFALIKNKVDIKGIVLYDHKFLFTAYADDSTFFLKDISSIKMLVKTFNEFSCFSGLKPDTTICEIAGLGLLNRVLEAVCGLKTADLTNDAIKILGTHFWYHNETKTEWNFLSAVKKYRTLSMYGIQGHLL